MLNGQLRILSPLYGLSTDVYPSLGTLVAHLFRTFHQNIEGLSAEINFIREVYMERRVSAIQDQTDDRAKSLYYYAQFSTVAVNLTLDSTTSDERTINRKYQKELESIAFLKNSFVPLNGHNGGVDLFAFVDFSRMRNEVMNFDLSLPERENIAEMTAPPSMQRSKNPLENNFILNYVRLNRRELRPLKKLHSGKFASIFLTEIDYWYVGSYSAQMEPLENPQPPHRKCVIIKREEKG